MSIKLEDDQTSSQEINPETSTQGMWVFFLSTKRKEDETHNPRQLGLKRLQKAIRQGNTLQHNVLPWAPRQSQNYSGVIGCVVNVNDENYMPDVYLSGWKIRTILGDLAQDVDLFYKTREAIEEGLSSQKGDQFICEYKLSRKGIFYKRKPENRRRWDIIDMPEYMKDSLDGSGIWLLHLSNECSNEGELSPRERALEKLVKASDTGRIALWEPKNGRNETEVVPIGCPLLGDENEYNIYKYGELIRDILGDEAEDVDLFYKTREAIDKALYSADGHTDICDYKLTNIGIFLKRNEVTRKWEKVSLTKMGE